MAYLTFTFGLSPLNFPLFRNFLAFMGLWRGLEHTRQDRVPSIFWICSIRHLNGPVENREKASQKVN